AASATVAANANAAAADPITYEEESGQLLTEFSPEVDAQNIRAAEKEFAFLSRQVFAQRRVALLTSRLKSPEKQRIVEGFRRGQIDVLVSTTVIEVGIDVPNATVMIIQDADRFGLSQLHQLRGRVGRGHKDAEVFLVSSTKGAEAKQRLQSLVDCDDGFQLAEADLSLRREGDVTGLRQHGAGALQLVQVVRDAELIAQALAEAIQVIDADPELQRPEHALLNYELGLFYPPPADAAAPPAADPADPAPNPAAPG
ncbi:MAG: ATP-dependent DNA helicase RecG, partial [Coriobacteriia bacterium]|nr:ATP-dependent DNA helicase RecG [Coriobacteriia bacterium]